jgi:hypothetical protein
MNKDLYFRLGFRARFGKYLPMDDNHFFLHLPMDDDHFGYKQKFFNKTLLP